MARSIEMRIVLDTSALVAFLFREPDANHYLEAMRRSAGMVLSALTLFEARTVLQARNPAAVQELDQLMNVLGIGVSPFDEQQAETAFNAYGRFGKGQGHPAQLNLCDCAAYALARTLNAPLLFKGQDFIHTDIIAALPLLVPEAELRQ